MPKIPKTPSSPRIPNLKPGGSLRIEPMNGPQGGFLMHHSPPGMGPTQTTYHPTMPNIPIPQPAPMPAAIKQRQPRMAQVAARRSASKAAQMVPKPPKPPSRGTSLF